MNPAKTFNLVAIAIAFFSFTILSGCSQIMGPSEAVAYDYIKPIIKEFRQQVKTLNEQGETSKEKFAEQAEKFYSDYEGKTIQLSDMAILGIAKIVDENNGVFKESTQDKKIPKYRLFLAPYKKFDDKMVAYGSLTYIEYDAMNSTYGNADIDSYAIEAKNFAPIDLVDDEMKGFTVIADIFDEALAKQIAPIQSIYGDKALYNNSTLDSIAKTRNISDYSISTPSELGLNFLLNSINLTVEFPKFESDYDYRSITSTAIAFDVKSINSINKLESPGRKLFEANYSMDYMTWSKNLPKVVKEYYYSDEYDFMDSDFDASTGYYTSPPQYYASTIDFGSKVKKLERTSLSNYSLNCYLTWEKLYPELGLKQIKPRETRDSLYSSLYTGTILEGKPFNGQFKGSFQYTADGKLLYISAFIYMNDISKKAYETAIKVLNKIQEKPELSSTVMGMVSQGFYTFADGKLRQMKFENAGSSIAFSLNESELLSELSCSFTDGTTCVLNNANQTIEINQQNGQVIQISSIDGSVLPVQ